MVWVLKFCFSPVLLPSSIHWLFLHIYLISVSTTQSRVSVPAPYPLLSLIVFKPVLFHCSSVQILFSRHSCCHLALFIPVFFPWSSSAPPLLHLFRLDLWFALCSLFHCLVSGLSSEPLPFCVSHFGFWITGLVSAFIKARFCCNVWNTCCSI